MKNSMTVGRLSCVRGSVLVRCALVVLSSVLPLLALEPPRPGEIAQMKADGTFPARLHDALAFSNHITHPALVRHLDEKLAKAQGITLPPADKMGKIPSDFASLGTNKILVLLIAFTDQPPSYTYASMTNMIFGSGTPAQYPRESLRNYYLRSSYGKLDIQGDVLGWYTCTNSRSFYKPDGAASDNAANCRIIREALNYYDSLGYDFSQYDNDHDGYVDYLAVYWTGPVGAWASFWWGYSWSLYSDMVTNDGVRFYNFTWQWQDNSPVVLLHETGHSLGLPDYYDYDDTIGPRGGVGGLDMMAGNYGDHNGFSKYMFDWIDCTFVTSSVYNVPVHAMAGTPEAFIMMPQVTNGTPFTEYFLAENRHRILNDTNSLGNGMLIWHVDARRSGGFLYDDSYTSHKLIRLMEADGLEEIENGGGANAGDYYTQGKSLSPYSKPNSRRYDGVNPWGGSDTWIKISVLSPNSAVLTCNFEYIGFPLLTNYYAMLNDAGDGDRHPEPDENARLWLWLKNTGGGIASNVTVTLTNVSAYLRVSNTTAIAYGAMAPDSIRSNATPFVVAISNACPAGSQLLRACVASDAGSWTTTFGVLVERVPAFRPQQTNLLLGAAPGDSDSQSLVVSNAGTMALTFIVASSNANYSLTDTATAAAPRYSWWDIAMNGTPVTFNNDDGVSSAYGIGFTFPFYGQSFTQFRIGINGAILFQGATLPAANSSLPASTVSGSFLPAYWDDLFFSTSDYCVRRWNDANQLVVSFIGVPRKGASSSPNTFQIVIRKNGEIRYQYLTMMGTLNSATVGIQGTNQPGNSVVAAFNSAYVANALATSFIPPITSMPPWLACAPTALTVQPGQATSILVTANAASLTPGLYRATVTLIHSDPDTDVLRVPVQFAVPECASACFLVLLGLFAARHAQ